MSSPRLACLPRRAACVRRSPTLAHTPRVQIPNGGACHISGRPYTVFRWRPGNDARYKKTIICQEVAKAKNVCQVRAGGGGGRAACYDGKAAAEQVAQPACSAAA